MDHNGSENRGLLNEDDQDTQYEIKVINPKTRNRWITIEPVAILYMLSLMPSFLLTEQYVFDKISAKYNLTSLETANNTACMRTVNESDPQYIAQQMVHSETSNWTLYSTIISTFPACIATLLLGPYSDSASRKIALIFPLTGAILSSMFYMFVYRFDLDIPYIFIGSFLGGVFGGFATMLMGFFSYTADISSHKWRTLHIVIIDLAMMFATSLSSIGAGYLIRSVGLFYPALAILLVHCLNMVYVILILPENIKGDSAAKLWSWKNIVRPFQIYTKSYDIRYKRHILLVALLIFFIFGLPLVGGQNILILFLQNTPLCFTVVFVSIYSALSLIVPSVIGLCTTLFLQRLLKDIGLLGIGITSGIAAALLLAFSTNYYMVFAVPLVAAFMYLPVPMLRSIMSKMIDAKEQGALFASIATVETLCSLFGSLILNPVYAQTTFVFGGAVFIVEAGMRAIALILTVILYFFLRRYAKDSHSVSVN